MNQESNKAREEILAEQAILKERMAALDQRIAVMISEQGPALPETSPPAGAEAPLTTPELWLPPPLPPPKSAATPTAATQFSAPPPHPVMQAPDSPPTGEGSGLPSVGSGLELKLGTSWLVRIGIVMLLTGFVFLANYYLFGDRLPPGVKVLLLYVGSFGLLGLGTWIERRHEALKNYGEVLAAGGFAAVYFTTFSAHRVEQLNVIHNPFVAGLFLLLWAGVMVTAADWKKSRTLGIIGVLLGYYTLLINEANSTLR